MTSETNDPGFLFSKMAELERAGLPFALATVVEVEGSTPRRVGAKILVLPDGSPLGSIGGGALELNVIREAEKALESGRSALFAYSLTPQDKGGIGTECGGEARIFIEVRGNRPRLVIVGGGHIGLALARAAQPLGFALTVVDPRETYASRDRFPPGTDTIQADPAAPETAEHIRPGADIVILTHSHELDRKTLKNLLGRDPGYIGMIGSRRKVKTVIERLEEEGIPKERLDRVSAPIGLDIGAETPEEIAVSILAEIIHVRRKGAPSPAGLKRSV